MLTVEATVMSSRKVKVNATTWTLVVTLFFTSDDKVSGNLVLNIAGGELKAWPAGKRVPVGIPT